MSAHHYFYDFAYCGGKIPRPLVAEVICLGGKPMCRLVNTRPQAYGCDGEVSFKVLDVKACIRQVETCRSSLGLQVDETDGLPLEFGGWHMNLRGSNTEPLLRLNIEAKADVTKVAQQFASVTKDLESVNA
ncbi:phosphohexomutase domain-containing protein [Mangrovitalea sediminis]|uniref:hypothetical protein n=1 Tax=Mangrovitalea sediminis TaxID=1982043 RepID=UPI000BE58FA9|nr:hypothetical protein [Mangrovitalea sediminis]